MVKKLHRFDIVTESANLRWMSDTISPSILFPLHFLAVLLQLLVCQLVEGVGRFWLWWVFRWADRRLIDKQRHKVIANNSGLWKEEEIFLVSTVTTVYRRTVSCYNTGKDLRLWSCCLHVLTILLSNLARNKKARYDISDICDRMWETEKAKSKEKSPCFVSQSPLEG